MVFIFGVIWLDDIPSIRTRAPNMDLRSRAKGFITSYLEWKSIGNNQSYRINTVKGEDGRIFGSQMNTKQAAL